MVSEVSEENTERGLDVLGKWVWRGTTGRGDTVHGS